jgi:hypothetical protein
MQYVESATDVFSSHFLNKEHSAVEFFPVTETCDLYMH